MIWQNMTLKEKEDFINHYLSIKHRIKKLGAIKASHEKFKKYTEYENNKYRNQIIELQKLYDNIKLDYICPNCSKQFNMTFYNIKLLIKDNNKLFFCNRSCSGKYYANKQYQNYTTKKLLARNLKIKSTLKNREKLLSQEYKNLRCKRLNNYWKNLDTKSRSIRNKENAYKGWKKLIETNNMKISKDELMVYNYLKSNNYNIISQIIKGGFIFDFKVDYNNQTTLIELNGSYWHNYRPFKNTINHRIEYNKLIKGNKHEKIIAKKWRYTDVNKLKYCKENNYNYIVIYFENHIKEDPVKVCKILIDNLNKGIKIITLEELDQIFADIG